MSTPSPRLPRRGYTLAELLVAMGVLLVVFGTALPLLFMGDKALSRQGDRAVETGAAASLLFDLSRDLRAAHTVALGKTRLALDDVVYQTTLTGVTRATAEAGDLRQYPRARFAVTNSGGVLHLNIRAGALQLQTAVVRRNR